MLYQWTIFAPAELEPPLIESAVHAQSDPDRSAAARQRFDEAARAVSSALDGSDYLVGKRFTVADVLVGGVLAFTERIGFADELPANLGTTWRDSRSDPPASEPSSARCLADDGSPSG